MSKLYLVATPIGNLEDISFRAVRILREVSLIAAEDTRTTKILLKKYDIDTSLTSFHDHNKESKTSRLLDHLENDDLALVSDAGTPAINDPGFYLVKAAIESGHQVIPVPGANAPITALSASGLATDSFLYLGYLPRKKKARVDLLEEVRGIFYTLVCLESPHRLVESLDDILAVLGDREIVVAREMTKIHEEFYRGNVSVVCDYYKSNPPKGEITLVLTGRNPKEKWNRKKLLQTIQEEENNSDTSPTKLAKSLAEKSGWSRREIYDLMQELRE